MTGLKPREVDSLCGAVLPAGFQGHGVCFLYSELWGSLFKVLGFSCVNGLQCSKVKFESRVCSGEPGFPCLLVLLPQEATSALSRLSGAGSD